MPTRAAPFISYSLNREDVLLNRLFESKYSGFFVDVGAAHPVFENDTKALSDRGWTGINIEPNVSLYRELVAQRPNDRNLNVAVSDHSEMITFHEVAGTGLSTCDPQEAKRAADRGFQVVQSVVEALPLSQILKDALPPQIDLLKIDVEGFEFKVVVGNNWQRFRPGVIMTEATFPETSVRRPDRITPFLEGQGYHRIYFDGLNDYYAERDLGMPNNVFDRPVNVFDNFIPHAHVLLLQARDSLAHDVEALTTERERSDAQIAFLSSANAVLQQSLDQLDRQFSLLTEKAHAQEVDLRRGNQEIVKLRRQIAELTSVMPGVPALEITRLQNEVAALRAFRRANRG